VKSHRQEIGFQRQGIYFRHPGTPYFVESISGLPSVCQEPISGFNDLGLETGKIRLLSPTDSNLALQENQPVSTATPY